jgi:hypothetical protein
VDQPPAAQTVTFRADLEPAGAGASAAYVWSPEPWDGQGTAVATYDVVMLEDAVQVEVEACAAYYAAVYDLAEAGLPASRAIDTPVMMAQAQLPDDFRRLHVGQTLNGQISPVNDIDLYYFDGTAGQRHSFYMNRTGGALEPSISLYDPTGTRVALGSTSSGVNRVINGYLLQQTGRYTLYAHDRYSGATGNYQVFVTAGAQASNPVPSITSLRPASAFGTFFGSDFWVAVYGSGFTPDSQVRINGQLRSRFYSSSNLVYIRALGGDLSWPWPRNAFITVQNPTPGGGSSNSYPFLIATPLLGETELEHPSGSAAVMTGETTSFRVRWAHPTDSWRVMAYMELRIVDVDGDVRARIRATEGDGATSTLGLHDGGGELVDEGLPGEARTMAFAGVELDLGPSTIAGSGMEVTMDAALTFGADAEGTYRLQFGIMPKVGDAQMDDVLGTLRVLSPACGSSATGVAIVPVD